MHLQLSGLSWSSLRVVNYLPGFEPCNKVLLCAHPTTRLTVDVERGGMPESHARFYVAEIALVLHYLHDSMHIGT